MNLMYSSVDGIDVTIAFIDVASIDGILGVNTGGAGQLAIHHVGQFQHLLFIGTFADVTGQESLGLVATVNQTVVHNGLAGVVQQLAGIGFRINGLELGGIPCGVPDDPYTAQTVQKLLYGLVGGGKAGVVATGREQLAHGGCRVVAHFHGVQQSRVLAI